jgi:hypothetical protein
MNLFPLPLPVVQAAAAYLRAMKVQARLVESEITDFALWTVVVRSVGFGDAERKARAQWVVAREKRLIADQAVTKALESLDAALASTAAGGSKT